MTADRAAWVKVLRDIFEWSGHLADVMCALQSRGSKLGRAGKRIDPPLPGGEALALRVPTADRTDPESVVRDYSLQLRRDLRDSVPLHRPFAGEVAYLLDHLDALMASEWADGCWEELGSAWLSLGEATGHLREVDGPEPPRDPRSMADEVPDATLLTLSQADKFWPGISGRVRTARSRSRGRKNLRPDEGPAQPDERGRYLVADLRRWHLTGAAQMM